ncbi:ArsA family ATPase, partial [Candidatus Woesearchaeota archaeon]|nr:ArsA family ATPase [Candidatus Woesearchaeota archaeon]
EVIIIDCPPTGETIRLLSASNSMRWYMDHFFETERKIVRVLGPALRAIAGTPYPDKIFYDVSKKMYEMVLEVESFLLDKNISSVRLVVNPEKMVIDESKRAYTYVNLFDYNVDAVVVNKKIPSHLNEPFFEKWKSIQLHESEEIKKVFHSMPILNVELFDQQIGGLEMLKKLGDAIYKDKNAAEILSNNNAHKIIKDGDKNILTLYLPNTNKEDLSIAANNEECIIKVNDYERKIMLPSSMVGYRPIKTKLSNDNLEIVFAKKK